MTAAGHSFGRRLRDARERKGIALEAVAESTKIKMSLLVGLERGDVSRWPNAIFRRAFVREYAAAIGLQPATVLAEFLKLFPEEGAEAADARPDGSREDGSLRLTLAVDETPLNRAMISNLLAAALDVAAILALAFSITRFSGTGFWATTAVAGLIYYSATTVLLGRSVASWWFNGRPASHAKRPTVSTVPHVMTADRFHIVSRRDSLHVAAPLAPELPQAADASPPAALAAHR